MDRAEQGAGAPVGESAVHPHAAAAARDRSNVLPLRTTEQNMLFTCSLPGTVLAAGAALGRVSGGSASAVLGAPARTLLQPWSHAELQHILRAARHGTVAGSTTLRFWHADGWGVEVPVAWSVLTGTTAEANRVVFVRADPWGGGPAGRAQPAQESLGALSRDIAAVADARGILTYVSPAVSDVFGYEADDVTGSDVWRFVHPDDVPAATAGYRALVDGATPGTAVLRLRAARGDWRWVKVVAVNRIHDPVGGVVFAVHDITGDVEADRGDEALRASAAMFRAIADTSEQGIWVVSAGRTIYANQCLAALLGVPLEQLYDLDLMRERHPEFAARVYDQIRTRSGWGTDRFEIEYAHPDGHERVLRVSAAPLRTEDGTHDGSVSMITDVTVVRVDDRSGRRR